MLSIQQKQHCKSGTRLPRQILNDAKIPVSVSFAPAQGYNAFTSHPKAV